MPVRSPHLLGDCPVVPLANPSHWTLTGDDDDDGDGDGGEGVRNKSQRSKYQMMI